MSYTDRKDPSRAVKLLTRAGHHLLRVNRNLALTGGHRIDLEAISEALDILWDAKRKVKAQEKIEAQLSFAKWSPK